MEKFSRLFCHMSSVQIKTGRKKGGRREGSGDCVGIERTFASDSCIALMLGVPVLGV